MKPTLTLILAFIVSAGMAQVNKHKDSVASYSSYLKITGPSFLGSANYKKTKTKPKNKKSAVLHFDGHAIPGGWTTSNISAEKYPEVLTRFPLYQTQPKIILSVSSPDSAGVTTVKFSRSQVHFINDSTFTFKVK